MLITKINKVSNINKSLSIEYLRVEFDFYNNLEEYQKMIEKIISMNTLKYIDIPLYIISNDDFLKIQGENTSIVKACILWLDNNDCILYNLQNKFPNLSNLNIFISDPSQGWNQNSFSSVEIIENPKCKTNQFSIASFLGMNIKFYIQSYENLVSIKFNIGWGFDISKNNFPLFKNNCKIIFKSLKNFSLLIETSKKINFDILNNIYNNIDNMPNLKSFVLKCTHKNITNELYFKFIKKILSMKLYYIELCLTNDHYFNENNHEEYSIAELKEICPKIDINIINHICIRKFNRKKLKK